MSRGRYSPWFPPPPWPFMQARSVAGVPVIWVTLPATSVTVTFTEIEPAASALASMQPTTTWPSPALADPWALVLPSESDTVTTSFGSGAWLKATNTFTQDASDGLIVLGGGPTTYATAGAGGACVSFISEPENVGVTPFGSQIVPVIGSVPSGRLLRSAAQDSKSLPPDCGCRSSPPTESEIWSAGSVGPANVATIVAAVCVAAFRYPAGLSGPAGTPTLVGAVAPPVSTVKCLHVGVSLPSASVCIMPTL